MFHMKLLMQYLTFALMAVGALAFVVAMIVQVTKELPWLKRIPTSVVALMVSMIMCVSDGRRLPVFYNRNYLVLLARGCYCCIYCVSGGHWRLGAGHKYLEADKI